MQPPTGKFSQLSLSKPDMTPVTRSHTNDGGNPGAAFGSQSGATQATPSVSGHPRSHQGKSPADESSEEGRDENDSEDENSDDDEDEDDGPVQSPLTGLFYNVDSLDDETEELVRELFRTQQPEETPPMVIEWCGISNDPDVYAFQLQEVVPRTIRIGSPTSRIPRPSCNCTGNATTPCRHLVWLMDQIAKQTLHEHQPDVPLVLDGATAFPRELGQGGRGEDAFRRISDFHIDILANTLHCGAGPPVTGRPNLHRVREAREILAGLDGVVDDEGVDGYAPEIFDLEKPKLERLLWGTDRQEEEEDNESDDSEADPMDEDDAETSTGGKKAGTRSGGEGDDGTSQANKSKTSAQKVDQPAQIVRDLVERGDLQRTVLRLLVSNDEFFAMFLKLLAPSDKARDPFRKIQQRVEAVLDALLKVRQSPQQIQQQLQQQHKSRLLMPPPDPRMRRAAPAVTTPAITITAASSSSAPPLLPPEDKSTAGVTVAWAAQHVQNAVHQIQLLLLQRQQSQPHQPHPKLWIRHSAGRALVWILHALVFYHNRDAHAGATQDDRNLYQRLVGNSDGSSPEKGGFFLLDVLALLPDQTHLRSQLKRIRRRIQVNGYREPYMRRLDEILADMNKEAEKEGQAGLSSLVPPPPPSTAGSKRQGSNTNTPTDRRPKRMK